MVSRNGTPAAVELIRAGVHHGTWDIDGPGIGAAAAGLVLRALGGEDLDGLCVASPIGRMITAERAKTWVPWDQRITRRPLRRPRPGRRPRRTAHRDALVRPRLAGPRRRRRAHRPRCTRSAWCPVGAIEQHGPHLPAGTDTIVASALCAAAGDADRLARAAGDLARGELRARHRAARHAVADPGPAGGHRAPVRALGGGHGPAPAAVRQRPPGQLGQPGRRHRLGPAAGAAAAGGHARLVGGRPGGAGRGHRRRRRHPRQPGRDRP